MRNLATAVTAALTCLLTGAAVSGCGAGGTSDERSAEEMFDDANDAMRALKSVRIEFTTSPAKGGSVTTRLVTDLDNRCRSKMSWSEGGSLEATKGETTRIDGRDALALTVTDKADKDGTFAVYVATEGKPYLLRVVYKGSKWRTTTSFRDFGEPLHVQAPKPAEVLDVPGLSD